MGTLNRVTLCGFLGRNPDTKHLENGMTVTKFTLATTDAAGGGKTVTTWHQCVAFSKVADVAGKYLKKGDLTLVEGRISIRQYDDKDGNKRTSFEVLVNSLVLLGGQRKNDEPAPEEQKPEQKWTQPEEDDDIPF
jgi:single-strand DNA-binding protein